MKANMKGNVELFYLTFITMSAILSVTWADGNSTAVTWTEQTGTLNTENTTMTTEMPQVSTVQQTQVETSGDPPSETGRSTTITSQSTQVNTRKESPVARESSTISCYTCSSNTTSEDDECYVEQEKEFNMIDCDKSCVITHYQNEDLQTAINITRSCDDCQTSGTDWECQNGQNIEMCMFCCTTDGCNGHVGNGATIITQTDFILTLCAIVTGIYLAE